LFGDDQDKRARDAREDRGIADDADEMMMHNTAPMGDAPGEETEETEIDTGAEQDANARGRRGDYGQTQRRSGGVVRRVRTWVAVGFAGLALGSAAAVPAQAEAPEPCPQKFTAMPYYAAPYGDLKDDNGNGVVCARPVIKDDGEVQTVVVIDDKESELKAG